MIKNRRDFVAGLLFVLCGIGYAWAASLHEIGHALGLSHSDNPRDVMWPGNNGVTLPRLRSKRQRARLWNCHQAASSVSAANADTQMVAWGLSK